MHCNQRNDCSLLDAIHKCVCVRVCAGVYNLQFIHSLHLVCTYCFSFIDLCISVCVYGFYWTLHLCEFAAHTHIFNFHLNKLPITLFRFFLQNGNASFTDAVCNVHIQLCKFVACDLAEISRQIFECISLYVDGYRVKVGYWMVSLGISSDW